MAIKKENILLIGATGFTGRRVIQQVENYNQLAGSQNETLIELTIFCRPKATPPMWSDGSKIEVIRGDLDDIASLKNALHAKDGLFYIASLGFGHAPNIIQACEEEKVKRAVFISTTAIFTKLNAGSKKVRMEAEATVIGSDLDWTILRPTMIYGRKGDRNMERLIKYLKKWPIVFCPGDGQASQQPVFVDDVATSVVQSYFCKKAIRKSYNISGEYSLSFKSVVKSASKALGKRHLFIPIPLGLCRFGLSIYEKLVKNPKLKEEQLLRLNENKAFEHHHATEDFNYTPRSFKDGISCLVEELNSND
jgi:nucleoside-diphosphate-sugar epimerase